MSTQTQEITKEKTKIHEPKRFMCVLYNDEKTTFDFVIYVLMEIFNKTAEEAISITMQIHNSEYGIAGVYSKEVAETKAEEVINLARSKGFPLVCSAKPQ